jgi:hypothetical protein
MLQGCPPATALLKALGPPRGGAKQRATLVLRHVLLPEEDNAPSASC